MNNNLAQIDLLDDMFDELEGLEFSGTSEALVQTPVEAKPSSKVVELTPQQAHVTNANAGKLDVTVLAQSGYKKLMRIRQELNSLFIERENVIDNALRSLVVGQSMLLLGPPGTGKSAFTNELCKRIDQTKFFGWLLNRTSDPAEILGPYSIKAMEKDRFLRKTEGKLPEAHIAFLDEIFKCNEPTLNILLPLINEKVFYNDGKAVPVPLISLFASSNELPEDESLDALYDRLIFRMWVDYIQDAGNKQRMYEGYLDKRAGVQLNSCTTITLHELQALQEMTTTVIVDKNVIKVFIKLLGTLSKQGIRVSDRRQNECFKVMQGNAVLKGRNQVTLDDMEALVYVLWEQKDDISIIESEIAKLVNPYDDKLTDITRKFGEIKTNLEGINDEADKCRASIEARGSIESLLGKFDNLIKEARKNGKDVSKMEKSRNEIVDYNQRLMQEALGINLAFDGESSPF